MRNKRTWTIMCILAPILSLILSTYFNIEKIPEIIFVREDSSLKSSYLVKLSENKESSTAVDSIQSKAKVKNVKVKLLGILPVKSVSVRSVPEISIYPGGISVGVKLNTKGVLVVALSDIETNKGKSISPAASSGIAIGDSILTVNGTPVENSEMLVREINKNEGKTIEFEIERKGQKLIKKVTPVKNIKEDKFKIGLWVRDSTAGVGTLTFYDEKSKKFAALGHPVTDVDTGTILNVNTGEVVSSSIVSIRKGMKGNPGELKGIFVNEDTILGTVTKNTECGIFGSANEKILNNIYNRYNKPMKIGLRNEIKEGKAQIITTIDENGPKAYDIEIVKLLNQETPGPKSMVIKVTDYKLLEKTGGIVQGMSGSPIIQNDKIIGAVTHVLINKPDTGYGIYIEWMLKDSDILTKQ
jgi:stage IV sporulation protein B